MFALFYVCFAAPARAVPAPADFFGISSAGMLGGEEEAAEVQMLGIHNMRVNLAWANAESSSSCNAAGSGPNWSYYDSVFQGAAEHNITILADLYGNRSSCNPSQFPEPKSQNYKDFVFAESGGFKGGFIWQAVERYGVNGVFWAEHPSVPYHPVRAWEVWNEPNLAENNPGGAVVNPQKYAKLLVDASAAIRSAQALRSGSSSDATVLIGGIYSGGGMSMSGYINSIYSSPSPEYTPMQFHNAFDGAGIHPYALSGSGESLSFGNAGVSTGQVLVDREVLNQKRAALGGLSDEAKTLWVTEIGWPTEFKAMPSLTPALQAQYLTEALSWMYSNAAAYKIEYAAPFVLEDYYSAGGCEAKSCWPRHSGLRSVVYTSEAKSPAYFFTDRPSRCAYKGLISGNFCGAWYSDNLEGGVNADPDIASKGLGKIEVFARGTNEQLFRKSWSQNGLWSSWSGLPGPLVTSGPGAVSSSPYRTDLVALVKGGEIEHWSDEGGAWAWEGLGGVGTSDPDITSWAPGRLDVFVRGTNNSLCHKSWEASTGWTAWGKIGGPALTSSPSAVSWGSNRIDVVGRIANGEIEHWVYNNGSWGWEAIGGNATSSPEIASWSPQRLDVFVRDTNNHLDHQSFDPVIGWSGWEVKPGASVTSGPGAVSWNANRIDVVAQVSGGSVQHFSWER